MRENRWVGTGRTVVVAVAMLMIAALAGGGTLARQGATPTAPADVPAASECVVEPLEAGDLLPLLTSNSGGDDLLAREPVAEASLPTGPEATAEETAGITAAVRQLVACANARDPFRIVALLSPDFQVALAGAVLGLQSQIEGDDPEADVQATLEERFPVPINVEDVDAEQQVAMIPIRDARLLTDGRVGAILEPVVEGVDAPVAFFVTFVLSEDTWLIDDVSVIASQGSGTPEATPGS
ncbi:MAG: hypothetical protein M3462_02755 [Chloroflexota bacterium]|nr:hypothetical protein [Chloroflexota bacterium]